MAFNPISSGEISTGKPVSATTQTKIKGNFDDHETRLQSLEGGATTTYTPLILEVCGPYADRAGKKGVVKTTTNFPIAITGVRLIIDKAGLSGITTVDVEYKRGAGAWTSIFTTKPTANASAGNDYTSAPAVLDPTKSGLLAGDLIRLNIDSAQAGGVGFFIRLDFNRA